MYPSHNRRFENPFFHINWICSEFVEYTYILIKRTGDIAATMLQTGPYQPFGTVQLLSMGAL